jgi:ATP-dependent DNA helicase RecG
MAGYIDTWGRGTLKIYKACSEHGLPEPDILEKDGGFFVALHKAGQVTVEGGQIGGQVGGQVGGQDESQIDTLTERQKEVLTLIIANPRVSRRQLAENFGINESAVQKHIDALKKKGVIKRESETTGQWTVIVKK